jgi:hypothetical protein
VFRWFQERREEERKKQGLPRMGIVLTPPSPKKINVGKAGKKVSEAI